MNIEAILEQEAATVSKTIEKYIPRVLSKGAILFRLSTPTYAYNLEALNKSIADPIWELLDRGGKRWRPTLFLLICEALGQNPNTYVDFAIIPEVIHNGTLIVDDIEDGSELRRGKPCTYKIYGLDIAINAGNAMYFLPLLPLIENRKGVSAEKLAKIFRVYTQEMINLSLGQAMDITWHRGLADADNIRENDYLQMCAYKTGTLARMSARIAAILSNANDELADKLGQYAENLGVAFQIRDDVLDLTSREFEKKKGSRGQDITEGKRSLVVIHTLEKANARDRQRLVKILKMHSSSAKLKAEAIGMMEKYDSIEYAKRFAQRIVKESWRDIEKHLNPSKSKEKLKAFAEFLTERKL